jgi:hypothetical protein
MTAKWDLVAYKTIAILGLRSIAAPFSIIWILNLESNFGLAVTKKHLLLHICFTCSFKIKIGFVLKLYKAMPFCVMKKRHSHFIKLLPFLLFYLKFRANLLKTLTKVCFAALQSMDII